MTRQAALPGMEAGKRAQRVEWGLRWFRDTVLHRKGYVEIRSSEEEARALVGKRELGWAGTEVVCRTVVTYITRWEKP